MIKGTFRQVESRVASMLDLKADELHGLLRIHRGKDIRATFIGRKLQHDGLVNDAGEMTSQGQKMFKEAEALGYELGPPPTPPPPKPLSEVTFAKPDDLDDLVRLLTVTRDEIDDGNVDVDLLAALAWDIVAHPHQGYGIVFVVRGKIVPIEASLGILFERPLLARTYRLRSVWNVVLPAARRSSHGKALLLAATGFADRIGRTLLLEAYMPPERLELDAKDQPKIGLFSRHLANSGRIFSHVPSERAA